MHIFIHSTTISTNAQQNWFTVVSFKNMVLVLLTNGLFQNICWTNLFKALLWVHHRYVKWMRCKMSYEIMKRSHWYPCVNTISLIFMKCRYLCRQRCIRNRKKVQKNVNCKKDSANERKNKDKHRIEQKTEASVKTRISCIFICFECSSCVLFAMKMSFSAVGHLECEALSCLKKYYWVLRFAWHVIKGLWVCFSHVKRFRPLFFAVIGVSVYVCVSKSAPEPPANCGVYAVR